MTRGIIGIYILHFLLLILSIFSHPVLPVPFLGSRVLSRVRSCQSFFFCTPFCPFDLPVPCLPYLIENSYKLQVYALVCAIQDPTDFIFMPLLRCICSVRDLILLIT